MGWEGERGEERGGRVVCACGWGGWDQVGGGGEREEGGEWE